MSNPDWSKMKFDLNNSDDEDDDEDEQQRQAEAKQQAEVESQRQAEAQRQAEVESQRRMFASAGIDPIAPIDEAGLEPHIQRKLQQQQDLDLQQIMYKNSLQLSMTNSQNIIQKQAIKQQQQLFQLQSQINIQDIHQHYQNLLSDSDKVVKHLQTI